MNEGVEEWAKTAKVTARREEQQVVLGDKYIDTITGFYGTAVARHEYLGGQVGITLEVGQPMHNGTPVSVTFDERRLAPGTTQPGGDWKRRIGERLSVPTT